MKGRVLIVAGSDSGGGAGIQADIKTVTMLDGFAATAITALTAQNTLGVFGILPIPSEFIRQQIEIVLDDIGADAVKTGMLHDAAVIETVAASLAERAPQVPLVLDPVMVAKGGATLIEPSAIDALKRLLAPRAAVLTPNLPEAEILAGKSIESVSAMHEAADALLALGCRAVLLKGGHLAGDMVHDVLATEAGHRVWSHARIESRHTHGTGCTLASAIAAGLAQGLAIEPAVERARDYVRHAIATAPGIGRGHGPLDHAHPLRAPQRAGDG
jgi:hydroxymethylpyrimidine/phosphomethylpyrimidine kinase